MAVRYETPVIKLAIERKLVTPVQHQQCRELVRKSWRIGLNTSIEEILIKQGFITREQIEELTEISRLGETGDLFAGYRLQKLIGKGGMGKVYSAVHEFTNRKVAIKILNYSYTKDETNVARFFQEVRALAKLNHPGIVTLYDAGKGGRRYYFAMELVEGPSLDQYVREKKRLPENQALAITKAAAEALGYSHKKNTIHRDIKPENIIIDSSNGVKVTDFGVVMHTDDDHLTLTREGYMVGSVHFASPEQVEGKRDIDGRSDIYSLGATLYFMLTGRTVYSGKNAQDILIKHVAGTWISPRRYNKNISIGTVRIIRKMMVKNRDKRYGTMEAVIDAIDGNSIGMRVVAIILKIAIILTLVGVGIGAELFFKAGSLLLNMN